MKVLVCTNGKRHVEGAITFSVDLLKRSRPTVTLLYVQSEGEAEEAGKTALETGRQSIRVFHPELEVLVKTRRGRVAQEILMETRQGSHDLLVMGSKGRSETIVGVSEFVISEVVDDVIRACPISAFVIKEPQPLSRVLLCTDGSTPAERAVTWWGQLKKTQEPRVTVLHVVPEIHARFRDFLSPTSARQLELLQGLPTEPARCLSQAKRILACFGIDAGMSLREGHAAEEILRESERGYDLIVMGFRGLKEATRPTLGSQTIKVMQHSTIPVVAWKG